MRYPRWMALVAGALLVLTACGGDDGDGTADGAGNGSANGSGDAPVEVALAEENDSGITGSATLTATDDGMTLVEVSLDGAGAGPQPIHIHPGTCAELDPMPQYPLTSVESGTSTTTVDASLDSLQAGTFAINVHKSVEEAQIYVACGDIT